jgi:hypothetical protein
VGHRLQAIQAWTGLTVSLGCAAAVLLPEAGPLRLPLYLAFICLGPGCAILAHLPIGDAPTAWALALGFSLTLVTAAATALALLAWWRPVAAAMILGGLTAAASAAALRRFRRPPAAPRGPDPPGQPGPSGGRPGWPAVAR